MTSTTSLAAACVDVYRAALARLPAARLVAEAIAAEPGLASRGPVRVAALGKAAAPMLEAAAGALGPLALDLLCIAPEGTPPPRPASGVASSPLVVSLSNHERALAPAAARPSTGSGRADAAVEVHLAGHPRPTAASLVAGERLLAWARAAAGRPALVLLSGGGSALAVAPAEDVSPEDKIEAVAALMRAGLPIGALNAVRKHLSRLKGGQLAAALAAAGAPAIRVLALSDVPGDDLSVIASGPLAPDPSTFAEAVAHARAAGAAGAGLPASVLRRLEAGAAGRLAETPKPGDPRLAAVRHTILAGPVDLARAAAEAARAAGFEADSDPAPLGGDVAEVAARLAAWAAQAAGRGRRLLALGGEPTVRIPPGAPAPDGGRAQHLALAAALAIEGRAAAVLAAGSDGRDGPTEQAGAVVDGDTAARARRLGVDLPGALAAARSGPAARALGAALPRADTGTHLCDLVLVAVA